METKKNLIHSQNFMVYTDEPQPELLGVTHNLSKEGMFQCTDTSKKKH